MKAWIGLGGNFGDSRSLMEQALALIAASSGITLLRQSRFYRSAPWGLEEQPEFINAVAEIDSDLSPGQLLGLLMETESRLGRDRSGMRWGPRCIDLDLLTYQDVVLESDDLEIPHPRMHQRAFVLVPILELEPDFVIPGKGNAAKCLAELDSGEVKSVTPMIDPKLES